MATLVSYRGAYRVVLVGEKLQENLREPLLLILDLNEASGEQE